MPEVFFDERIAKQYATLWPELFDPSVVDPCVEFLTHLAGDGAALEFGLGTGRIAIPLAARGVPVHGIEVSAAMAAAFRDQAGSDGVGVTIGDFARTAVDGTYRIVYLLRNTITNLTTQADQVACFRNAAAHLEPGGRFVIENYVPELRRLPPGQTVHPFEMSARHVGFEEYDVANQVAISHHWWFLDGEVLRFASPHRYVWPAELDLMADIAGLRLVERWSDWDRSPFTSESRAHVSVWEKPT